MPEPPQRLSLDDFMPLIPIHAKILTRLIAQRKVDPNGGIGWRGPLEDLGTTLPTEMIYGPLLDRGMVEDLTETEFGMKSGVFFVRITDLGVACAQLGMMLREGRRIDLARLPGVGAAE